MTCRLRLLASSPPSRISSSLRAALRRRATGADGEPIFAVGELTVDLAHRRVGLGSREIHLTPTEYRLLTTLVRDAGKVLTHRHLLREVWGPHVDDAHTLRVHMAALRRKLEAEPANPRYILTEPGVGYRLAAE